MKKAVIVGATSGIGRALAVELHGRGYRVGATGRRIERLEELKSELEHRIHIQFMDVTRLEEAWKHLHSLIGQMGGMDIIVLNAGITDFQTKSTWDKEQKLIAVNISGFASLASRSFEHFKEQGHGHIVGISSVASLFGSGL
ncbi:MAG: SDR family NAD(P)-dependent oxidoreductase, partial [Balneolaceae bacterium]|nr:SDR family NAD(P)-dependent oxidoreductase [Balneolaceae bacterium]